MQLARVSGTITATVKDSQFTGSAFLICDIIDAEETILEPSCIAVDTVGAGVGDLVLITRGSASRIASKTTGMPVDAAIVAVVDEVTHKPK
jgi:ethanolamine utilization protein EutN